MDLIFAKASPPIPSSDVAKVEHAESIEEVPDLVELSNSLNRIDQHFSASGEDTIQIVLQTQTDRKSFIIATHFWLI